MSGNGEIGSSGGTRGGSGSSGEAPQISAVFMKNMAQGNMMFTLDEEDDETEYGESFKSSVKSSMNTKMGRMQRQDSLSDEDEDDDLDPDQESTLFYRQENRKGEFSDGGIIYQNITIKDIQKDQVKVQPGKVNEL